MADNNLDVRLLVRAGVEGIDQLERVIEILRRSGASTEQLSEEAERLRREWDNLSPEEQARRIAELARQLADAQRRNGGLNDEAERSVGVFGRFKGAIVAVGAALGITFVASKIKGFFSDAVSGAQEFEEQLSTVKAVSGATAEDMDALRAAAEKMGAETKYTATEAAQGLENLARAGLSASESIAALPSVLALAQGNSIELADAASYITQAAAGMGLEMDEAARVADVLAKAASSANTDIQGMGLAMSYAAPTAHALGLTLEETAAYIGKLADAGFDGSRAGTAMATMMGQFQNPASTFRKELAALGIRTRDFNQAIRELAAAGPQGQAAISALGEAAGPAFLALVGQGISAVDELHGKLQDASGFAIGQAKEMGNNVAGAFAELGSAWDAVKLKLATPILEPLRDKLNELSKVISDLVNSGKIEELGRKIASVFSDGADAVIRFVKEMDFDSVINKASSGFEKLKTIGTALNGAFQALSITFNAVKAGLAAIAGLLAAVASKIFATLSSLTNGLGSVAEKLGAKGLGQSMHEIGASMDDMAKSAENFAGAMSEVIEDTSASMADSARSIAGVSKETNETVAKSAKDAIDKTADAADAGEKHFVGFAQTVIDTAQEVTAIVQRETNKQAKAAEEAAQKAKEAQEKAAIAAASAFEELGIDLDEVFNGVSSKTKKAMSDYTYAVQQAMEGGLDATKAARAGFEALAAKMSSPQEWAALKQQMTESGDVMDKLTQGQIKRMGDGIKGLPDAAATAMAELKQRIDSADLGSLARIGTEAKAAFAAGELSAKQYAEVLAQVEKKTEELRAKTAQAGETATQAHAQAAQAAEASAKAQEKAADAVEKSGEAVKKTSTAMWQLYDATKLNAEAVNLLDDALNKINPGSKIGGGIRYWQMQQNAAAEYIATVQAAERATEMLNQKTSDGTVTMQDVAEAANKAYSRITALDSTTLKNLNASIDAAKQKLEDLAQQARDTSASLDAELAQLKGDNSKTAALEQERKLRELNAKLQEAQARRNADEIAQYQRAIELQKQIYAEKQRQDAAKKAEESQRAQESRNRSNSTRSSTGSTTRSGRDISPEQVVDAWDERIAAAEKRGAQNTINAIYNAAKRGTR
ncbi:phage tail tape measure protein [uncultured Cardiobacterium sp.]|uniref:phage tail tape measure protein n=1 Tax=uncultured Cardiobacterium sp. TaxID=417619 RepID=UPI002607D7DF|nr:phage tail tape measure protein [uncultured Cardiobacterium sp.]